MSVLLPPPKRQKVYHGVPEPESQQVLEEPIPNVVVQFVNDQDGSPLAPAVNLPANVTKDALESLVNKLKPQVSLSKSFLTVLSPISCKDDDPVPFLFHINASAEAIASGAPSRLVISNSINQDVLSHPSHAFSPEDVFVIHCSPQAVFKVRPATRCSSTLSGTFSALSLYRSSRVSDRTARFTLSYLLLTFCTKVIPRQSSVHHFLRRGIFSRPVPVIAMQGCGICSPKLRPTCYLVTRVGCSVSNGKLWRGSSQQEVMMVM